MTSLLTLCACSQNWIPKETWCMSLLDQIRWILVQCHTVSPVLPDMTVINMYWLSTQWDLVGLNAPKKLSWIKGQGGQSVCVPQPPYRKKEKKKSKWKDLPKEILSECEVSHKNHRDTTTHLISHNAYLCPGTLSYSSTKLCLFFFLLLRQIKIDTVLACEKCAMCFQQDSSYLGKCCIKPPNPQNMASTSIYTSISYVI